MSIEPWQIPVLVMAVIAGPISIIWLAGWLRDRGPTRSGSTVTSLRGISDVGRERLRTTVLSVLTVVLLGVFFTAAGAETANIFASVASAVSTLVSAVLTLQSFLVLQDIRKERVKPGTLETDGQAPESRDSSQNHQAGAATDSTQPHSVAIYLDTDSPKVQDAVLKAAADAMYYLGFTGQDNYSEDHGSIFASWRSRIRKGLTKAEVVKRLEAAERMLEDVLPGKLRAEMGSHEAEAIANLIRELQDVPNACLRLSSFLIVKYQMQDGPVVHGRILSHAEIHAFEQFPEMQKDPRKVLDQLALALAERPTEGA